MTDCNSERAKLLLSQRFVRSLALVVFHIFGGES